MGLMIHSEDGSLSPDYTPAEERYEPLCLHSSMKSFTGLAKGMLQLMHLCTVPFFALNWTFQNLN